MVHQPHIYPGHVSSSLRNSLKGKFEEQNAKVTCVLSSVAGEAGASTCLWGPGPGLGLHRQQILRSGGLGFSARLKAVQSPEGGTSGSLSSTEACRHSAPLF
jgi:hypothetical protein